MTKTLKIIIFIVIAVIVIVGIWYGVTRKPAEKEAIKIGVILPLSGELAALGEEVKRGIEIAADEYINYIPLKIIYEDDQSLVPAAAVSGAKKLLDIDKIDIGLTSVVEESKPITPLFVNKKIPLLVLWDSNKFIKEAGEYLFSNGFSTEKSAETLATYAFNDLNLRNVAIIGIIDPAMEIFSGSFKGKFENLGGKIVYNEEVMPNTADFRTSILKIKQSNPDGVYFLFMPLDNATFLMQAKQLGLRAVLLGADGMTQDAIIEAKDASEGIYFTNIHTGKAGLLTEKYKAKYNSDPIDPTLVSIGYDGMAKAVEAVEISRKSGEPLKDSMDQIFGPSRSAERVEKIYKVVGGKAVEVK